MSSKVLDCSGLTVQSSPVQFSLVWSSAKSLPDLHCERKTLRIEERTTRLHSQGRQAVSNSLKQNTYLRQPAKRAGGEVVEPRGKPGSGGEGDSEGDPARERVLKAVHPKGKNRNKKREKYLACATSK